MCLPIKFFLSERKKYWPQHTSVIVDSDLYGYVRSGIHGKRATQS